MLENFKYILEDSILFEHSWLENNQQLVQAYTKKLETKKNYITKVLAFNYNTERYKYHNLNIGDKVFLSRYVGSLTKFELGDSTKNYSNAHPLQVLGVFRKEEMTLDSLEILDNKILVEPLEDLNEGSIQLVQTKDCTIGKVVKCGKGSFFTDFTRKSKLPVEVGDTVLFWDNTSTTITLNNKRYLCFDESRLAAVFKEGILDTEHLEVMDGQAILEEVDEVIEQGIIIAKGDFDASTRAENLFKVVKVSECGVEVSPNVYSEREDICKGDTVVIDSINTYNVTYKSKEWLVCDIADIEAVLG